VVKGLDVGEKVITGGGVGLDDGAKVRIAAAPADKDDDKDDKAEKGDKDDKGDKDAKGDKDDKADKDDKPAPDGKK
jgi:hypothetical protein